ncbi:hypothetical protein QZH41_013247, partial [Actinostola sp. cb2023]
NGRFRAFAPPISCRRSLYGCCWDMVTAAQSRGGKGCPVCANRHNVVCKVFRWMCTKRKPNADYIKMNCPVACGKCKPRRNADTSGEPSLVHLYISAMRKLRKAQRRAQRRRE